MSENTITLLVDNGSLNPWSPLNLRCVAYGLSERLGKPVHPVSVDFSDRIATSELNGEAAEVLEPFVRKHYAAGVRVFEVLPFMFAEGGGIAAMMRRKLKKLQAELAGMELRMAPFLFDEACADNTAVARVLAAQVRGVIGEHALTRPAVVLVDHGSPKPQPTYVRNMICGQLAVLLGEAVGCVGAASMERREGEAYAFNEPLLETRLRTAPFNAGEVVVAMLFLSPGRHAGTGGDVAEICTEAEAAATASLRTYRTPLVGEHPDTIELVAARAARLR